MRNTVNVVVHTFKPSSLAHSLQIHCIGFTGLRIHASWAWLGKRVPIIGAVCGKSLCVSKRNDQSQWGQALTTKSPLERPLWRWYKLHEILPPYFLKHIVVVVIQPPLRSILRSVDYVGRVVK